MKIQNLKNLQFMKKDIHLDNIITHTIWDTISSLIIFIEIEGYLELNDALK